MALGNGDTKFQITATDMGGWVRVFLDSGHPVDLPTYLSQSLASWFRERPHLHVRSVVPISRDGDTVELHAWFDAHVFAPPTTSPRAR